MAEKRTLNPFWIKQLKEKLKLLAERKQNNHKEDENSPLRMAVVGVGSELNGDDAAGLWVARGLQELPQVRPHFAVIDAGTMPESSAGSLRKFKPDLVILVDAADFGGLAGEIRWLDSASIGGFSASTHSFPLSMIAGYLQQELNCEVALLGIQPAALEFAAPLTAKVQNAVDEIVATIPDVSD